MSRVARRFFFKILPDVVVVVVVVSFLCSLLLLRDDDFLERRGRFAPFDVAQTQIRYEFSHFVGFDAHLFARISLAYSHRAIFRRRRVSDGSVVDRDGKRNAEFVRSAVSFADGDGGGV